MNEYERRVLYSSGYELLEEDVKREREKERKREREREREVEVRDNEMQWTRQQKWFGLRPNIM